MDTYDQPRAVVFFIAIHIVNYQQLSVPAACCNCSLSLLDEVLVKSAIFLLNTVIRSFLHIRKKNVCYLPNMQFFMVIGSDWIIQFRGTVK
jgi:hypothetical protein